MSHYKPYPAYKDSGVEWLGRVPEHWVTKKLLYWISGYGSGTTPSREDDYSSDGLLWVTTGELRENTVFLTEKRITCDALKSNSALKLHPAGSLVIAMYGATVGRLGVLGVDATLNQACFAIHPNNRVRIPFLRNWFEGFRAELVGLAAGAGQPNISGDKIRNLLLPCPQDLSEQEAIVSHLDRETARIDALIEKKTRFIELLREKRQALLTHAVTKGLDPNVKMKDSGVEWLGEMPEHWELKQLKHLVRFKSGGTPSKDNIAFWDGDTPWASAKDLKQEMLADTINHLTQLAVESGAASLVPSGSILVVVRGMILARLFPVVETQVPMAINQDLKALIPSEDLNSRYLAHLLRGSSAESLSRLEEAGHGTKALRMENWVSMEMPVPPLHEQLAIVAMLDTQAARIDSLATKSEHSIALLKERRSALITAAVTGQIDLREAV